jgi:hypothetical protein
LPWSKLLRPTAGLVEPNEERQECSKRGHQRNEKAEAGALAQNKAADHDQAADQKMMLGKKVATQRPLIATMGIPMT